MKFENVVLESIAYELPPLVWSSAYIEELLSPLYQRLKLPFGRLELMTGIKERRFWPENFRPSDKAAIAGQKVLKASSIKKKDIDLLINASVCRNKIEPATAAYVHSQLNLGEHVKFFDLSNACLGFLNAMVVAGNMIEMGSIKSAMIVAAENGLSLVKNTIKKLCEGEYNRKQIKPFFANLTIGGGAVAVILAHKDYVVGKKNYLRSIIVESDTKHNNLCEGESLGEAGLDMQTESEQMLKAGVSMAKRGWRKFKKSVGIKLTQIDRFICHQVGHRHLNELYKALKLDMKKDFSTFSHLGNVGSVSVPITLAQAIESGVIKSGSNVALLGIGSGLSSLMMSLYFE